MSWALEEWKEGLPTRALQKIQELEGQLDKLKKEKQQRQFQLEALEDALQKQKQKVENEKTEGTNLKRENQRLMEICENLEKTKQKISHELQVKESQVNFQEGQMNSGKKQIEKLEQELKRCKSELERSQQTVQSADISLNPCSTPQKISTTPLTPSQHYIGSKYEDLKEKYNKEVEERNRLEAEVKALKAKKMSQAVPQTTMNHRDIARHQSSSSVFSWQEEKASSASFQKTPIRRNASASHFWGEEEVTPNRSVLPEVRNDGNRSFCDNSCSSRVLEQFKAQNQELRSKVNELELRLQGQEKEMKSQVNKFQELQLQLEKAKVELSEKEKILNKNRDELVRTTVHCDQATAKCTALEQKLKKLTEDLSCQRQNAESARCSLEQKIKAKEKELQEELSRQHRSFQALDQEYTQVKARLTQELQQAKNALGILQVELDKVTSVKQQLERNFEEFKQKFTRTEQALQASQLTENELRKSLEEMKKENSLFRSQSEERAKEVCHLEEELRKVKGCLIQSEDFAEEMRAKNTSQETMLRDLQEKIIQENPLTLEKLKLSLVDLEQQRDCSQDLLKKREHHIEQLNDKLSNIEKEFSALQNALELNKKAYEELKEEKTQFSYWKNENEKLINQLESEKESLQSKISHLDTCLKTQQVKSHEYNERVKTLEMERENLNVEIRNLHNVINSKLVEVEAQKQAYLELQQKAEFSDQKHQKEKENMCLKTSQLTEQVESLEHKLQFLSSEIMAKDQLYQDLHTEYESLQDLLRSRDSLVTSEDQQRRSLAFEQRPAMNNSLANLMGEQGIILSERSECHVDAYQSPDIAAISQNGGASPEFFVESEKQMNSDLQKQCEELVRIKGETEENLKAEQIHQSISALQEESSVHQHVVVETSVAYKEKELQFLKEKLEAKQTEIQELKTSSHLLEDTLKELQLLSETLSAEKKEMSSIISLSKKEIEELTQENGALKEINETLSQEKKNLLQKNEKISSCVEEQDQSISQLSDQYKQERVALLHQCEETSIALEELHQQYKAAQEQSTTWERLFNECTAACEQLKETFAKEQQELLIKLATSKEQNEKLILELEIVRQTLRSEIIDIQNNSKSEADGLRQEIMSLKEEQNKMQKEVNDFLQESEQLMELMKSKQGHYNLELEPGRDSVKETENEREKCNFQYQMDLDIKGIAPHSYKAQLVKLEALIRLMELKLEESEKEKESLQQELQIIRGELGTVNLQHSQSQESRDLKDQEVDAAGQFISVLQELSSQKDNVQLQCSLQAAMSKLNELENMCEILRVEKLELESELNDSRAECITATSKLTEEAEKLVNEMKVLNSERMLDGEFAGQQNLQQCDTSVSLNPLDNNSFYEQMTLSNKEVQVHFAQLQERFSCLQSEHKILHDQHCQVSSKMSELRSYVDTLKAENSALSMNLRSLQGDLVKERKPGLQEEHLVSLSFSCVTDSPDPTNFGESSFYKDVSEHTGDTSVLSNLEGNVLANPCNVDEVSYSNLEEADLTEKEIPSASVRTVEELEVLCQVYLQSLKTLEEKIENQEIMKNKEIQELEQLLSSERSELDCLKKQYLSENEHWQQKLTSVTLDMESKLAAEKKQTKHLSLELEVARLQLQGLDLSSQSLLGTSMGDVAIPDQNDSCDVKESELYTSETTEETPKQDIDQICDKDSQQDLGLETGITKYAIDGLTGEQCNHQSLETDCETPAKDKTQDCSELFSVSNALVPMDILDNQVSIQRLQLQEGGSNENLKLLHAIEDKDKKIESLLHEIKEIDSKFDVQEVQLKTKMETCIQLEKIVKELKKDKCDFREKLGSFTCDNQELVQIIECSEGLSSNLAMGADEFLDEVVEGAAGNMEVNWKEKFLDVEKELTMVQSEKARIEHNTLSLEADLEMFQTQKLCLEKENENKQKIIVHLEEELSVVVGERNRLHGELNTVSEENKALGQMSEKMKEKIQELESHQSDSLCHIQIVEAEVEDKIELLQTLSSDVSKLTRDRAHLQEQLQALQKDAQALSLKTEELESQIGQLNKEKESLIMESQNLQAKLGESEHEKLNISKALEVALMEKGEFAVRLGSTQEEVHQLRRGMEKLSVRIEADEKKQLHVVVKLKESQRENDLLKDKVENLEKELQMSEENQELAILDAENSKAEVETLKAQIDEMTESHRIFELDLVSVRSEKENLTKQLQERQGKVSELDELVSSFRSLLEEKEQARVQIEEESKAAVQMLQTQLKELSDIVAALCSDDDTCKAQEQSPDLSVEAVHQLRRGIEKLSVRIEADEKKQLHVVEQLKESQHENDLLKDKVENLERELQTSKENQELAILDAENSKAEVETLKAQIDEMTESHRIFELDLVSVRSEKENLTKQLQERQGKVSELDELVSSFRSLLEEKEQARVQIEEESKAAVQMLQTQLKELSDIVAALCSDDDTCKAQEQSPDLSVEAVHQLRRGIEKLSVRIEADEKKQLHVVEQLKESQHENDLLKDKVENLERELQTSKENQELAILDAENSKAEVETLKAQIDEMTESHRIFELDLVSVRSEKENLTKQLQERQGKVSELDELVSSFRSLLEEKEQARVQIEEESKAAVQMLQTQLKELSDIVAALCSDDDTCKAQEQSPDLSVEAVHQLRRGIEKLSVRIEADEKKQLHVVEQLKESQHENDLLKDKVENLERELQTSKENQELAILDAENSKAEVETLKAQIDEMTESHRIFELDLVSVRSEKENLTKQLQERQGKVSELDELVSSFRSLLEEKEQARVQIEEESKAALQMLQTQLKELSDIVAALCSDDDTCKAQEQSPDLSVEAVHQLKRGIEKLSVRIEADEKQQLQILEQLKESQNNVDLLKDRIENLEQELELSEKNRELMVLEAKNAKAEVETLKTEIQGMAQSLRDLEIEFINTRAKSENLTKELQKEQERVSELEIINNSVENLLQEKEQEKIQMKKDSEIALEMLQTQLKEFNERVVTLCNDQETHKTTQQNLNSQVRSLELEKAQLLQDLDEAKSNCIILQSSVNGLIQEVDDGKQKLEKKGEEFRRLEGQLKDREQLISKLAQVEGEQQLWQKQKLELGNLTIELEQKIQMLQSQNDTLQRTFEELQNSGKKLESELELMRMEKVSLVKRVNTMAAEEAKLHKELQNMVQKTTELKEEFNRERTRLTEESNMLTDELKNAKIDQLKYVNQLEKKFESAQGKIKLLLKSCKQLEGEKKMLQKELSKLEAAQAQQADSLVDNNVDKLMTEIKELKETLEEKTKEAEEYLDKYCSLLISHEKLENAKEMLQTQVTHLHSQHSKHRQSSPLLNSAVPRSSPTPSVGEKRLLTGRNKASGKRQRSTGMWENGGGPTPSTPETFSKKSRKVVQSGTHSTENEKEAEFEPEGLPEVVKKGFADIPTGKTSPYILRRTTMATRTSPRLAAQKMVQPPLTLSKENVAESSKPTAGGSRSHKAKVAQRSPVDSGTAFPELPVKSSIANNVPERSSAESPREGLRNKRGGLVPMLDARPDPKNSENCRVQ